MPRIGYLAHDLSDSSVAKRCQMLVSGGATPLVAGYRRAELLKHNTAGVVPLDLGQTKNRALGRRMLSVLSDAINIKPIALHFRDAESLVARNIEMLMLALRVRKYLNQRVPITYECLDIHPLMLSKSKVSQLLRLAEQVGLRHSQGLIISSPAFLDKYFIPYQKLSLPIRIQENKLFPPQSRTARTGAPVNGSSGPWVLAWLGLIRCRRSLKILVQTANRLAGHLSVKIYGKIAYDAIPDFDEIASSSPWVSFHGAYKPIELGNIYGSSDFCWTIDYLDGGQNSQWLLPNRIYEGSLHGAVLLAVHSTQIANWMLERKVGVILENAEQDLESFFWSLTPEIYAFYSSLSGNVPAEDLIATLNECEALVNFINRQQC